MLKKTILLASMNSERPTGGAGGAKLVSVKVRSEFLKCDVPLLSV
jgi:hypothetical protein